MKRRGFLGLLGLVAAFPALSKVPAKASAVEEVPTVVNKPTRATTYVWEIIPLNTQTVEPTSYRSREEEFLAMLRPTKVVTPEEIGNIAPEAWKNYKVVAQSEEEAFAKAISLGWTEGTFTLQAPIFRNNVQSSSFSIRFR